LRPPKPLKLPAFTFKQFAEDYIDGREHSWRNPKHRQQWRNTLTAYAYPVIGDLALADIGTPHVLKILEPIWKTKTETASRVRGRVETILDAAKVREYRTGENPARWRGHLAEILPARNRLSRGHHKAMPYDAISAFVARLRDREAVAALALEFTVLTAARSGEVIGATWAEVDLAKAVWTIPARRMKAGKEHRVPLSSRAVAILAEAQKLNTTGQNDASLFPSAKSGKMSTMAMSMLLRRMKVDATVHGFRSGFRDWSAECTAYAHEVCEMALAHVIGNKAEAAYRRGDLFDKRRRLMEDWANYCSTPAVSKSKVTPIRADRA
jgi:integrase